MNFARIYGRDKRDIFFLKKKHLGSDHKHPIIFGHHGRIYQCRNVKFHYFFRVDTSTDRAFKNKMSSTKYPPSSDVLVPEPTYLKPI